MCDLNQRVQCECSQSAVRVQFMCSECSSCSVHVQCCCNSGRRSRVLGSLMPHGRTAVNSRNCVFPKIVMNLCVSKNRNLIFQNSPPQDEPIVAYCGTANCYAEIYSFVVCVLCRNLLFRSMLEENPSREETS